jgi:hypothetical protein
VTEWIGWVATAAFAASYLFKAPEQLRRVQAVAACLWIGYGLQMKSAPVVVANGIVAVMAIASSRRGKPMPTSEKATP